MTCPEGEFGRPSPVCIKPAKNCIQRSEAMNRLEQLELQIAELGASELKALRAWFECYDAEVWDRQIESDAKSGKLGRLAERALNDHRAGRSTEL